MWRRPPTTLSTSARSAVFREVRDRYIDTKAPPASTAVQVVKLAAPEYLFEIEAIAVVPER